MVPEVQAVSAAVSAAKVGAKLAAQSAAKVGAGRGSPPARAPAVRCPAGDAAYTGAMPPPRRAIPSRPAPGARAAGRTGPAADLGAMGARFRALIAQGDFAQALAVAQQALARAPGHAGVLADLALAQLRLGQHEAARRSYLQALATRPDDDNLLDGLAEVCGYLGRIDEAVRHGRRSLDLKAAAVAAEAGHELPAGPPPPFDPSQPGRHIVAFSLFGDNPRYGETAFLNVGAVARLLPGWTARIYCDASVPAGLRARLAAAGAQVHEVDADTARDISGLMWRFLVLDDPGVSRYLLRDADSLVSTREAAAVQAWLDSDRWFHALRDYHTHTELLLAGLWGGCGGVFQGMAARMRAYMAGIESVGARVIDQHFLRRHAWPTVRQSLLMHDSVFAWHGAQPWPPHAPHGLGATFHVGSNFGAAAIGADTDAADGTPIAWRLIDEHGQEVCAYQARAAGKAWRASLPQPYIDAIRDGRWKVVLGA